VRMLSNETVTKQEIMRQRNRRLEGSGSKAAKVIFTVCFLSILFFASAQDSSTGIENSHPIPFIHTADLIHPPWDPDDQVDLGCLYALPEFDIKAIIIDNPIDHSKMEMYEPAFGLISQLNWLTGRAIPVAVGPNTKLRSPDDAGEYFSLRNQAGIKLLIEQLEAAEEPAYISIVGSSRIVAAAFNREPELFRKKVRAILIVAGIDDREIGDKLDANTIFDPNAFIAIMRSGLPIIWHPVGRSSVHGTAFIVPHEILFKNLPKKLHAWMMFGFTGNQRGDIIRVLHEEWYAGTWWGVVMGGERHLWSIPSIVMAADRKLINTDEGWRFIPENQVPENTEEFKLDLIPVKVQIDENAHTKWKQVKKSNILLFTKNPDQDLYNKAMGEAVNALLRSMPLEDSSPLH